MYSWTDPSNIVQNLPLVQQVSASLMLPSPNHSVNNSPFIRDDCWYEFFYFICIFTLMMYLVKTYECVGFGRGISFSTNTPPLCQYH
ncbi:hypothetical protein BDZ91DRAFT_723318 [Kalaharituber pfeilii]|nr:hypothetical protein BDZ91DRAFT_723318 [Kalaharituber pfeilii]